MNELSILNNNNNAKDIYLELNLEDLCKLDNETKDYVLAIHNY